MVEGRCQTPLIQSINQWLHHCVKAVTYQKNVIELGPTNSRYPSLNYPRSRIEFASVLAIITSFLKDTLYREEVGRVWKWSHFDLRRFKAHFLTCFRAFFFSTIEAFDIFFSYFKRSHLSTCYSPLFSKLRESTQGVAVLTRREVDHGVRAQVEAPFKSWLFSLLPVLVQLV